MSDLVLHVGSRNHSSWSLRAHLVLARSGLPFREELILLDRPGTAERIAQVSPTGRVPVLHHGELVIPDSLAIAEYVAELAPAAGLWPADRAARARARAAVAEMHAGFGNLREQMTMHLRLRRRRTPSPEVQRELERLWRLWSECLDGSGGPLLFGPFTVADAFFAPVATRLRTYEVDVPAALRPYVAALLALPDLVAWERASADEPPVPRYEPA